MVQNHTTYIPKGPGIRDTRSMNEVLQARIAWRIIENPDNPCSTLLKHKYFRKSKPTIARKKKTPSPWFWKCFIKGKDTLMNNAVWEVGMGQIKIYELNHGFLTTKDTLKFLDLHQKSNPTQSRIYSYQG